MAYSGSMGARPFHPLALPIGILVSLLLSCGFDWDALDPRLGQAGASGAGGGVRDSGAEDSSETAGAGGGAGSGGASDGSAGTGGAGGSTSDGGAGKGGAVLD